MGLAGARRPLQPRLGLHSRRRLGTARPSCTRSLRSGSGVWRFCQTFAEAPTLFLHKKLMPTSPSFALRSHSSLPSSTLRSRRAQTLPQAACSPSSKRPGPVPTLQWSPVRLSWAVCSAPSLIVRARGSSCGTCTTSVFRRQRWLGSLRGSALTPLRPPPLLNRSSWSSRATSTSGTRGRRSLT
jgi:hypothetical protein